MLSFSLGPVALPVAPLLLILSVWGASWLAGRLAARQVEQQAAAAGNHVISAALLGLLAARLAHLGVNLDLYAATPWAAFHVRDGGWHAPTGAAAAVAGLLWFGWRAAPLRRPLTLAVLAAAAGWFALSTALGVRDAPPLPALAVRALDSGASVPLPQAARGRPVVVNLWASWCGPCRQEMPLLAAAQQREPGVGFLFVNQGESAAAVQAYLTDQGLPLREVLLDAGSQLGRAVGSPGLPTTLFYDAQGRRVDAHFGVLSTAALESRLRLIRLPSPAH